MTECSCPVSGFCERRNAVIPELHHQKCQQGDVETIDAIYMPGPAPAAKLPGDVLQRILKERYNLEAGSCSCAEWIARMNSWGAAGCTEHMEAIVDHLFSEASSNPAVSTAIRAALKVPVLGPMEGRRRIRELVKEAVRESQEGPTIKTSVEELAKFFVQPARGLPAGWRNWPNVLEYHRQLVTAAVAASTAEDDPHESRTGSGIVMPAGGLCYVYSRTEPTPYFWQAYAAAWNLRYRGCELPIQFWFLPGEMEQIPNAARYAANVGATCHLLDTADMRVVGGWQTKVHAILQSGFRYVIHMDADNMVVRNPEYLIQQCLNDDVAAHFWGDNPNLHDYRGYVYPETWSRLGSWRTDVARDIETGQMVIDVQRSLRALAVAKHLANHADYWGGYNGGDSGLWYGDKTDFHVAFALTETPYFVDQRFDWNHGGFYRHYGPRGELVFEHCCHRKAEIVGGRTITNLHSNFAISQAKASRVLQPVDITLRDALLMVNPREYAVTGDGGELEWYRDFAQNAAGLPDVFPAGSVVLDCDPQSGAFLRAAALRGATAIAVEPDARRRTRISFNCQEQIKAGTVELWDSLSPLEFAQKYACIRLRSGVEVKSVIHGIEYDLASRAERVILTPAQ